MSRRHLKSVPSEGKQTMADTLHAILVTGNGCPSCDDEGCSVCNSQLRIADGTINPPTKRNKP